MKKMRLALFASGTGSNALNIINFFANSEKVEACVVFSNKIDAPVLINAKKIGASIVVFTNTQAENGAFLLAELNKNKIDLIILAGYLRKIPVELILAFHNRIINVHPSLLPKFGGPGMYGGKVHQAVCDAKEIETGISIHYVNENFDEGALICQFHTAVAPTDQPADIAKKVQLLEHRFFPVVVDYLIDNLIQVQ